MEHNLEIFLFTVLGLILALFISCILLLVFKRIKLIPFTVLLVLVGIFVRPGSFQPFDAIRISPGFVLFIILPILLFESAFNFEFKEFKKVLLPSFLFATLGLTISSIIVALPLHFFAKIDFGSSLLFGAVISSTDPIAVLAIFKDLGVPKKLQLLVDGESFLNDGTSVIFFRILVGIVTGISSSKIDTEDLFFNGIGNFIFVILGGAIFGIFMGWLFSQIIYQIKNENLIEILMTVILAISVFIIADHYLKVSGIIAVLAAGLVLGNYGRNKISPKIAHELHQVWDMLVFVSTSLIFLLIGYEIHILKFFENFKIILLVIFAVLTGRAISVYLTGFLHNLVIARKNKIPLSWLHIVNIGGVRGSLPLVMLLLIPENFEHRSLFIDLSLSVIFFTLIVNASIIKTIIKKLNIDKLSKVNKIEMKIVEALVYEKILDKLEKFKKINEIGDAIYQKHKEDLKQKMSLVKNELDTLVDNSKNNKLHAEMEKILDRYCLNIEKSVYKSLYTRGVINEGILRRLLSSISELLDLIDEGNTHITFDNLKKSKAYDCLKINYDDKAAISTIIDNIFNKNYIDQIKKSYVFHKARIIGDQQVINDLQNFHKIGFDVFSKEIVESKITQYKKLLSHNNYTLKCIEKSFPDIAEEAEDQLFEIESDDVLYCMIKKLGEEERVSYKALKNLDLKI